MMEERGDFVDNTNGRNDLGLHGERNDEKERPFSRHSGAEEREASLLMRRGNEGQFREEVNNHGQFRLRTLAQFSDHGLSIRDPDATSSRFQWTNFLPESKNLRVDGIKEDFQGCVYDSYGRKYVRVMEKSVPTETERIRNLPAYSHGVGISEYMGPPRNLSGHLLEDSNNFRVGENPPHQDREMSRRTCDERSFPRFHSHDNSPILAPGPQSRGQHNPSQVVPVDTLQGLCQEIRRPADACIYGNNVQLVRSDNHQQMGSRAGTNIHRFSNKAVNYSREEYIRNVGRPRDYCYQESPRFSRLHPSALPEDIYDKVQNTQDYYGQGETIMNDALDHTLHRLVTIRNSPKFVVRKDGLQSSGDDLQEKPNIDNYDVRRHDHEPEYERLGLVPRDSYHEYGLQNFGDDLQEKPTIDNYDLRRHNHEPECERLGFVPRGSYHEYGIEASESYEALPHGEAHVCETNICCEEEKYYVTGQQGGDFITDEDTLQRMESGDFDFSAKHNKTLKRNHRLVGTLNRPKRRATTIGSRGALSHDNVPSVRSFSYHRELQTRENIGVSKAKTEQPFGGLSEALQSRLSKPHESGRGNIQKRLKRSHVIPHPCHPQPHKFGWKYPKHYAKPCPNVFNAISTPQPHGSTKSTKFKKRLKTSPQMLIAPQDPEVSHPGANIEKQHKSSIEDFGSTKEAFQSQEDDLDHLKLMVKPAEKDLPEHSEEFKRQIHEWFLKCLQLLTANPGRYRRFKEQGKAGSLKCFICFSSKEFMDTKDVAMHAFASLKVGFRAQHLGFHRAICVLMGWDTATAPNGRWVFRSLPDADAWALKEDVIIWPPVVIVHNSYAGNNNQNDQVKISTEHLGTILRVEGFDEGKAKVCQGKAGSPDIMVVKFSGTLSGLQEAERLHNLFVEKNHGRNELQQATSKVSFSEDTQAQEPLDKLEDALYGYLGIIEDSDKLHYDMRRYCCAKSKKEILAFSDTAT